ncbi:hypothetical protein [Hyphomonas sp.]|jgi:phage terminase large subunit-like protein|uniref:hypothetical protein n=1 Tax=Hyphomonas sp. TaxID=87 RepID=UPI0039E4711C
MRASVSGHAPCRWRCCKVAHVGLRATLEDQMCRFGAEGFAGSPDRVDALVWAVRALMLERGEGPRIRAL